MTPGRYDRGGVSQQWSPRAPVYISSPFPAEREKRTCHSTLLSAIRATPPSLLSSAVDARPLFRYTSKLARHPSRPSCLWDSVDVPDVGVGPDSCVFSNPLPVAFGPLPGAPCTPGRPCAATSNTSPGMSD